MVHSLAFFRHAGIGGEVVRLALALAKLGELTVPRVEITSNINSFAKMYGVIIVNSL
jgi:hypothetical protein